MMTAPRITAGKIRKIRGKLYHHSAGCELIPINANPAAG
jgi:hypothetical protein